MVPGADGVVKLFVRGHMLEVATEQGLKEMIAWLNTGNKSSVRTLLSNCLPSDAPVAKREALRSILASLCSFRAIATS